LDLAEAPSPDEDEEGAVVAAMVATIKWYKEWISPLIGPNCRFYPTCSSYGITSITEYGPAKGLILTAWRILRCNPVGGQGYDPPQWPPPGYFSSSKNPPSN